MNTKSILRVAAMVFIVFLLCAGDALAQRRGGGGRGGGRGGGGHHFSRGGARSSITARPRPAPRPSVSRPSASRPSASRPSASRPSVSQPIAGRAGDIRGSAPNRIVNTDREVNINNRYGGNYDYRWDGCCDHPVAAAAVVGATAAAIADVGTVVYPSYYDPYYYAPSYYDSYPETTTVTVTPYSDTASCPVEVIGGVTYMNCNGTWYQPQFTGTDTSYVVVSAPR